MRFLDHNVVSLSLCGMSECPYFHSTHCHSPHATVAEELEFEVILHEIGCCCVLFLQIWLLVAFDVVGNRTHST